MVNEKVNVKDKHRKKKKFLKYFSILIIIAVIIAAIFLIGFFTKKSENKIVLENPLKDLVYANTNEQGLVNKQAVIDQAILEFNAEYINFLLIALGVGNLHKSYIGYGNPIVQLNLDGTSWTSEISNKQLQTSQTSSEDKDLLITLSRQEAIEALLSPDMSAFMKNSVINGNTQIEMIANKAELASKGYLAMYTQITGEEIEIEE